MNTYGTGSADSLQAMVKRNEQTANDNLDARVCLAKGFILWIPSALIIQFHGFPPPHKTGCFSTWYPHGHHHDSSLCTKQGTVSFILLSTTIRTDCDLE